MFWSMNPKKIIPYQKARELESKDEMKMFNVKAYLQARYFCESLACTVGNMFGGNNKFPEEPFPIFEETKVLSEEEKEKQVAALFANLEIMKHNFEIEHQGNR